MYGVSYGTNLALQLLRDHPEGIRAMVLDGVVPPQTRSVEVDWAAAATGYQALFDACARQPQCHSAFPNVHMPNSPVLVNDLTEQPRTMTVPISIPDTGSMSIVDGYKLANLVVRASSDPELRTEIPLIVHDLATGNGIEGRSGPSAVQRADRAVRVRTSAGRAMPRIRTADQPRTDARRG